jgi:disulfide oxidoreductase YuzD
MEIVWDEQKNEWLKVTRLVSFEKISGMLQDGDYLDIVENPTRENQEYFVLKIRGYTWLVPFVVDEDERIVLKTAFPSRKYHKKFRGKK